MKTVSLLLTALLLAPGGDREKGLRLYREGRFQEAAAAFEAAIANEGDSAELQYNLALARWRAGDLANAETAVEKYVAMAGDARTDLHAGVLGAVRYDEAKALESKADAMGGGGSMQLQPRGQPPAQPPAQPAEPEDPLPVLEAALQKATQAKDYFVRGAVAATSPELQRNTERTLRYIDALQKKIDELKKQREEQKKDDDKKDDDKKDDKDKKDKKDEKDKDDKKDEKKDEKQDEKKDDKKDPQKSDEKQPDEKPKEGEGEQKPEPKPDEQPSEPKKPDQQQPQPGKPDEKQDEPKPEPGKPADKPEEQKPRHDAPGEVEEGKELSPEQAQRLLDQLQKLDEQLKSFRARAKSGRRPVERDW